MSRKACRRVKVGAAFQPWSPIWALRGGLRLSRAIGADDLWLADHTKQFFPASAWDPQSNPMARLFPSFDAWLDPTAVIARYCRPRGPRMGTMVTDPVRRTAADLARNWLSLHHLTRGNVVLGIGAGEANNLEPIGHPVNKLAARLEDTVAAIRAAWSSNCRPITHSGPFHEWNDAIFLPPYRGTVPPIWIGAQSPRTCEIAGRWGDGWLFIHEELTRYRTARQWVAKGASDAGRDLNTMERSILVFGAVVSGPEQLEKACQSTYFKLLGLIQSGPEWKAAGGTHPFGDSFSGPHSLKPELLEEAQLTRALDATTPDILTKLMPCGTAGEVADYIAALVDEGVSHVIYANLAGTAGWDVAVDSLREQWRLNQLLKRMPIRNEF